MKYVKWIVLSLVALAVIVVAAGLLMPREVGASRDIVIAAPPDKIFPHINDLRAFSKWSPWTGRDPAMTQQYSGPDSGVGQTMTWRSDKDDVGSGTMVISESTPDKTVATNLDFGSMGSAKARFDLAPESDGTRVTWSFTTDLGNNPIARLMGSMIADSVGKDYAEGLTKLKQAVETGG